MIGVVRFVIDNKWLGESYELAWTVQCRKEERRRIMKSIALQRLHLLPISRGTGLSTKKSLILQAELAKVGVRIRNAELLVEASEVFLLEHAQVMERLTVMRGGDVTYVPLFLGFPSEVPQGDAYFAKRIMGYLGNAYELFADEPSVEDGSVIPRWLFALEDFGANPVTQMQDRSLWQKAKERLSSRISDTHVEWIELELVFEDELAKRLEEWMRSCLYAKSSIKELWHKDLSACLSFFGAKSIDASEISMKENLALLLRLLWQTQRYEDVATIAKTPTDLLRLFAALGGSDVALTAPVRFPKLSRKQRVVVLSILEGAFDLAADLKRYKGLWLALGRGLHPGEYKKRFPKAAAAFDALRNSRIETFESKTEKYLADGQMRDLLVHLKKRPGTFARKFHEVLRRFEGHRSAVMETFSELASTISVKNLLILQSYFESINDDQYRTIINKKGNIKVIDNNSRNSLSDSTLEKVQGVLKDAIGQALSERESWAGKGVWVDPRTATCTVPLSQRAASDGLLTLGRGSRIPVDCSKVLRLFVYWKQAQRRTDLDLSALQFDENFAYAGHVSYTNLAEDGVIHSGDLQSAPHGAAEFIDVSIKALPAKVRYLAVMVYRYAGDAFADMDCHAGWMVREKASGKYKGFDIKTVQNKFDLKGHAGYCVPLIVDLQRKEIIMTDLYMGSKSFHNSVEGSFAYLAKVSREISRFSDTKPTVFELAESHVRARGAHFCEEEEADIRFGVDLPPSPDTYNTGDVERILSELL